MTKDQLKEHCEAELEKIETTLAELFLVVEPEKTEYSTADLAAMATFIHNFYSGIENILKRILLFKQKEIQESPTWHKDLLKSALDMKIIRQELFDKLSNYLSFRHFFIHGYGFTLKWDALKPLVDNAKKKLRRFQIHNLQRDNRLN
ncbi:MAG: hypothetical protein ABIH22_02570 [Candidatus Margulisiibacteriota bacterium]